MTISAGKYVIAHFETTPDQYENAWNAVFGGWLPQSGYQPEDGPCYELYPRDPKEHPEGKHIVARGTAGKYNGGGRGKC